LKLKKEEQKFTFDTETMGEKAMPDRLFEVLCNDKILINISKYLTFTNLVNLNHTAPQFRNSKCWKTIFRTKLQDVQIVQSEIVKIQKEIKDEIDKALPDLQEAEAALSATNANDMKEIAV
jgi:hypothetical protein